jgi:hypothetical protein
MDKCRGWLAPITALPPAAEGGVVNAMLAGEIGGGPSAAIKRRQKLAASDHISAGCPATRRNSVLLHVRVFITARRRRIGGRCLSAY